VFFQAEDGIRDATVTGVQTCALPILEKSDVHIVARIGKVVGIAAVEGDIRLRGKHQAHIGISFVAVKIEDAALKERDRVAAQSEIGRASCREGGKNGARYGCREERR